MSPNEPEALVKPERWREVEALFLAARDREPRERATFLDQACGEDTELRHEVESLLAADRGATGFLEPPGALSPLTPDIETTLKAELAGRYALEGELGRGGMATVYLAEDVRHHRRVAIKVLHPELGAVLGAERFLREIGIAARLSHPHILPLHDSGTLDIGVGRPVLFYAMPYVAGRSLRERLREELQLPMDEALGIARQVADALDHAHRQGVIHRDIKPENILLADGQAVLADFGIARALDVAAGDRLTETGLAVGTPAYMSPEQAAGATRLDGRSDIYALGCVLYEMLGGQPPFLGPTPQAILARHAMDPVPSLRTLRPTVPRALGQVVTRALAKVPADRFPTARAFAEALAEASSAPAGPGDESATATLAIRRRQARRRRGLVAAAAGAAITAAGLAAVLARKPLPLEPRRVLVLAFQNRTGDSTLDAVGDVAADYLIRGLRATQMVEEVLDARSQGEASAARRLNATSARAAARAAGAGNIVLGAYDRAPGDSVQFQAEVLDTRTGRAVRLIGPLSAPVGARLVALEGLRTRVMAAVGSLLEPDFSEATSLPATYEALVEWKAGIDGWDACGGPGCRGQVLEHFRRAATIDSNFTLPLTEAAFKSWQVGDCARVDSIAAALRPRLVRLPPVDGTQLEVAASLCHGDLPAALDAATGGVDGAPADERLLSWKAMVLLFSNRPRETIDILERFDETRALEPGQDVALLLDAYHRVGMYDRALAYIAQVGRVKLNTSADPRDLLLEQKVACLAALGRLDDAAKTMEDEVRQFGAYQQGVRVIGMLEGAGQELAAHGHALAAKQAFDRAIAWAQAQPADQQATSDSRRALASVLNSAGRWDEALALYRAVAAVDSSDTEVQAALGDLAARRGDRADAERIDRWLAAQGHLRREGAWSESWALYHRGRLAGLLGERERAIGLLRQAAQIGFSGWWVAHVDPDLAPLRADPAFQEWIRPKD